ncbi:MAG TPA: hypothetical protein DEP87_00430 [Candidatus Pacebacteria bacterium]|nr:hypothetical protein [Candidatus Paceibacterota bacterium]
MKVARYIQSELQTSLQPGRAVILLGARRVGKTTLIRSLIDTTSKKVAFFNCDDPDVRAQFFNIGFQALQRLLTNIDVVIFDEAQRIKNIGITLKLITDELPSKKLLVTGSSSLELSNQINEPLTGRKKTFQLFPISVLELWHQENQEALAIKSRLDDLLRFGSYPKIFDLDSHQEKEEYLLELTGDYLFKDILEYQNVRSPEQIRKLLIALALQIGQEVSLPELGNIVGIDQKTVTRYLDLLEKSFVIFRLPALSRNLRKEISKSRKIYFYDLGIRNSLIKNFNHYDLRQDRGQVWENFLVSERRKKDHYQRLAKNYYFWRTYNQKEIDLVEEKSGLMSGFEFKWQSHNFVKPADFLASYPGSDITIINQQNFLDFVL